MRDFTNSKTFSVNEIVGGALAGNIIGRNGSSQRGIEVGLVNGLVFHLLLPLRV